MILSPVSMGHAESTDSVVDSGGSFRRAGGAGGGLNPGQCTYSAAGVFLRFGSTIGGAISGRQGAVDFGNDHLTAGDYLYTPPNGKYAVWSSGGCVLLLSVLEE